jgi:hypothetical protein
MKTNTRFLSYLAHFFLEWEFFQKKFVDNIKTHIKLYLKFFSENRAVYEIRWKNIVDPDRSQMTIRHMRFACWIPKATNTHSEYVILIDFHSNNGCKNAPQYKSIHALPVLFSYSAWRRMRMGEIAPLILNSNDVCRWVVNSPTHSRLLYPWEKGPRFTFIRRLEDSRSRCGLLGEVIPNNVLAPAIEQGTVVCTSHCSVSSFSITSQVP